MFGVRSCNRTLLLMVKAEGRGSGMGVVRRAHHERNVNPLTLTLSIDPLHSEEQRVPRARAPKKRAFDGLMISRRKKGVRHRSEAEPDPAPLPKVSARRKGPLVKLGPSAGHPLLRISGASGVTAWAMRAGHAGGVP